MPTFSTERRVPHSAGEMFDLVADVEAYPLFLPLCESLVVRGRREEKGKQILVADMTVAYKIIRETFTSRVTLDRANLVIEASYLDGPFRHLDNRWTFASAGEGACVVNFWIEYEFRSRALDALMGAMFDRAFRKFTEAFEARADQVYGATRERSLAS
jgi:coenzyme Q-binding protein COQ10